ncbi:MAG: para-aminobenzoate synthase, (PABA) [Geoglossum umbratile]|nr:MAG: para-aminobenzoate synthase, (PABA) [Geoglossum umbratile]
MAANPPDSKSLKTWDDAFQYPIPTVRQLEQQLRSELASNQERLRTLVGASYRDLLGTAERIVEMDGTMRQAETHLGIISQKHKASFTASPYNKAETDRTVRFVDSKRYTFASQLAVLQACPAVISRLLRKGGSSLIAAKILVVSRLLHKSLSQAPSAPSLVEKLRNQLASLRRHLLRHIDRQFSNPNASASTLIEPMCAFSLATSSSPTDVLRHFHYVRHQAIATQLDRNEEKHSNILKALKLYIQTLLDTQAGFPERLAASLSRLKLRPLLRDPDVLAAVELGLDVHEKWISDDIKFFTPWIRHDDLQKSQVGILLKGWSKQVFAALIEGLRRSLSSVEDIRALVGLRTDILEVWLDGRNRVVGFTSVESLERLRSVINERLLELIRGRAHRLCLVGEQITATLQDWEVGITESREDLWSSSTTSMDISNGAAEFKSMVLDRLHGRNEAVLGVLRGYDTWLNLILEVTTIVKELRGQRWDEGVDDVEDEIDLESRAQQLSGDDPELLEDQLGRALTTAFQELGNVISSAATGSEQGPQAIFLLRILREIRQRSPGLGNTDAFGRSIIPTLHSRVAETTSFTSLRLFERLTSKVRWDRNAPARALWEGTPQLPVQPSPGAFKLLCGLVASMAEQGDIWSPTATRALKSHVGGRIYRVLSAVLVPVNHSEELVNRHEPEEMGDASGLEASHQPPTSMNQDWAIQLLFDVIFFETVLSTTAEPGEEPVTGLGELVQTLDARASMTEQLRERLRKATQEYWKRTYLLFSFLA